MVGIQSVRAVCIQTPALQIHRMQRSTPEARPENRVCTAQHFQSPVDKHPPEVVEFAFKWMQGNKMRTCSPCR
ncbi:hypothetical protein E2C01_070170 [Portunus trituberculatus]|uniref:Uncharacterized protein n=1 Tax=Portunus trituberculatus TaxID=210409 RepID=A0A5B7I0V9_PORTR|nr:hypothetical protein [Portunus trituberculatus]